MSNIHLSLLLFFTFTFSFAWGQDEGHRFVKSEKTYKYRVYFKDKKHNIHSIKHPETFLSEKALQRRKKFKIKVDKFDLPVSQIYLDYLCQDKYKVVNVSKWNNTAVVEISDTLALAGLKKLSFIKSYKKVWESPDSVPVAEVCERKEKIENRRDTVASYYGAAELQNKMIHVDKLHNSGFKGRGITVAVIDGGFYNADLIEGLAQCNVLGTHNFVNPKVSVYEENQPHGTMVLSCIAANLPNSLVGTAPDASFYLLVSEDNASEQMVEEDNWCSAVEFADSAGVDIITSSLGYHQFEGDTLHYYELDGNTEINSRSASLAASRGLIIINSAGNEGEDTWKKICCPADAKDIFTVGAVNKHQQNTNFSSIGHTADGRVKPEVMALGEKASLLDRYGNVNKANGTSFSTPIFCGAVACLLQAFPNTSPKEMIKAVIRSGDNYEYPDNIYGYGIPNMWKAYKILERK